MSGSDHEPSDAPYEAAEQMREATQRLRDKAWMMSRPGSSGSGETTVVEQATA